ncbi:PREDICTED: uncharacterized protein C17orf105-like [Amphimedon queenslandica]|uniref:Cilia- and flagella-associated protein 97 n=1 Tax=Amphimedon queenslandica TaxID=400682 RepID=A0A1X7U3F5_AMPQE|nr:PREDICTED: uncharacterized protein C17orf105-like [Amphimedon queenslandica]|eukprot:XP_011406110.1 PREDICTED: uncharacterized protein C17orf105-like [Amphimedon queenslandica]
MAYRSLTPANNMFLKRKWDQVRYETHRDKIMNAKSVIDNRMPAMYLNAPSNLKKLQMEAERQARIDRENRILLGKITNIINKRNEEMLKFCRSYRPKSLNRNQRELNLLRIAYENQIIAKRIREKQSHYSREEWLKQWCTNRQYMANVSKYPRASISSLDYEKDEKSDKIKKRTSTSSKESS